MSDVKEAIIKDLDVLTHTEICQVYKFIRRNIIANTPHKELQARCETAEERVVILEAALQQSMVAIDDWLNTYAYDLCDENDVKEANERIWNGGGTIAYIADVQQANRTALAHPTEASKE